MEKDWVLIYQADEEYKAEIIKQLLEDNGLHPVLMDHKDNEFRLGQVELFVSPLEMDQAKTVIAENQSTESQN